MTALLAGIGTLYLLFALVIISHALTMGILIIVTASVAGLVLLTRPTESAESADFADSDVRDDEPARAWTALPPAEQLAVDLAEEPSERLPAQRTPTTEAGRELQPTGR